MQREIEALLKVYVDDREREGQLVTELLTAIAVGASSRRRMIDDITAAVSRLQLVERGHSISDPHSGYDPVSEAVGQLRSAREMAIAN